MIEITLLCTKNRHFTYNVVYLQTDGVTMSSSLGTALDGISMVHSEGSLVSFLTAQLSSLTQQNSLAFP